MSRKKRMSMAAKNAHKKTCNRRRGEEYEKRKTGTRRTSTRRRREGEEPRRMTELS